MGKTPKSVGNIKTAYKYKIKPTVKQKHLFAQISGNCRFIYNWALARSKEKYEKDKSTYTDFDMMADMAVLRKDPEYKWLKLSSCTTLRCALIDLYAAFSNFFSHTAEYPQFKSKKRSKLSFRFPDPSVDFENSTIHVPLVGRIRLYGTNRPDVEKARPLSAAISKDSAGDYWCTITVDLGEKVPKKVEVSEETAVGVDLGIKDYAITSDGTKYENPKYLEQAQKRLAGLQQGLSKMTKGSKNYEKQRLKIARQHRKITNKRKDMLHKLSTDIVNKYDTVCMEDLGIKEMQENHRLAQSIASASWYEFRRQVDYKTEKKGKNLILINRYSPSTKTCSKCGYVKDDMTLDVREWVCPVCGEHHDRDINAAVNIKRMGLQQHEEEINNPAI